MKLLGVCGETELANAKQSLITMMQVGLKFLVGHLIFLRQLANVFESLFGSVTCLPSCFTLYRLGTPDTHNPLLISNQLIHDYSENRVDTLHMKNLHQENDTLSDLSDLSCTRHVRRNKTHLMDLT
jgi:chitin synthase